MAEIRRLVRAQHLDYPSDEYVEGLRARVTPPSPFKPEDKLHNRSFNFLTRHQLLGFYHPDDHSMMAHRFMLYLPRAKELIEGLALSGEKAPSIVSRLKSLDIRATIPAVQRYLSYYWDLSLVDSMELRALLRMRVEYPNYQSEMGELPPQDRLQRDAMKKAAYGDARMMVASMSSSPMAGILSQMRYGYMPTKADLSRLASATRVAALVRAYDVMLDGRASEAAGAGQGFALIAKLMGEILEDVGGGDELLASQLHQLAVKTDTQPVPTLFQLSQGNHATDMGPTVVNGEPVKEPIDG